MNTKSKVCVLTCVILGQGYQGLHDPRGFSGDI